MGDKIASKFWGLFTRRLSEDSALLNSQRTSPEQRSSTTSNEKVDLPAANDTKEKVSPDVNDAERQVSPKSTQREGQPAYVEHGNGKLVLTEAGAYQFLGFSFPRFKKWTILTIVFLVQVSMNFNTSLYSNSLEGMTKEFGISAQTGRTGAMAFLICYAFGCELWAPWSEDFGRWPIMQLSLLLVNIWQLPVALATNFGTVIAGRILGGFSSAGGSVTLAMVADMWEPEDQQWAVAFVVFSSVAGSVIGPVVGGFAEAYLNWRWCIWLQLIFGVFVQLLHLFFVPETRSTILLDRIAKKQRLAGGEPNVYGPNELIPLKERLSWGEIVRTWARPFHMFIHEPIVMWLSLLSGFSDALIFMFIQSFALVYGRWEFSTPAIGMSFVPILIGYFMGYAIFAYAIKRNVARRAKESNNEYAQYEHRLYYLLWTAPLLPLGLIGFAWTSTGPPLPWIVSMIFSAMVGIANYAIYMATIDYMITAYGPYSASATGGNGFARDFLAGVLTLPAMPFFENIGTGRNTVAWPSTILAIISTVLVGAVWIIYKKGAQLRKNSPFAQDLSHGNDPIRKDRPVGRVRGDSQASRAEHTSTEPFPEMKEEPAAAGTRENPHPLEAMRPDVGKRTHSWTRSQQDLRVHQALGSRVHTPLASGHNSPQGRSRNASPVRQEEGSGSTSGVVTPGITSHSQARQGYFHQDHASELHRGISLVAENPEERVLAGVASRGRQE